MSRLQGRVAIVTGSSRGIGAAIAVRLAAEGAKTVVNYQRNADAAERVVETIREAGGQAIALQADVADPDAVRRLFTQGASAFAPPDILVNSAGVAEFLPIDTVPLESFDRLFAVNVRGLLFATQEFLRHFTGREGRIINISSGAAQACPPGAAVYVASKAAVEALTRSNAQELGPRGITVNAVAPGITASDMLDQVITGEARAQMVAQTARRRLGQPEDIAAVVAFLASEDAAWVTGQIVNASGGLR